MHARKTFPHWVNAPWTFFPAPVPAPKTNKLDPVDAPISSSRSPFSVLTAPHFSLLHVCITVRLAGGQIGQRRFQADCVLVPAFIRTIGVDVVAGVLVVPELFLARLDTNLEFIPSHLRHTEGQGSRPGPMRPSAPLQTSDNDKPKPSALS